MLNRHITVPTDDSIRQTRERARETALEDYIARGWKHVQQEAAKLRELEQDLERRRIERNKAAWIPMSEFREPAYA